MTTKTLDDFTGAYGPAWVTGVLVDHLAAATEAGLLAHTAPSGKTYLTGPQGGAAVPVLCGEVILIHTEDGPISGRCGLPVEAGDGACPGHWAEILSYRTDYDHLYEWET